MDLDITLFFQLGLIALLVLVMRPLLFRPLLEVIEARAQQTEGARREVKQMERLSHADQDAYQTRMQAARREASLLRERLRQEGRDLARAQVDKARLEVSQAMQASREEVAAAERAAAGELNRDTQTLARLVVARLLGEAGVT